MTMCRTGVSQEASAVWGAVDSTRSSAANQTPMIQQHRVFMVFLAGPNTVDLAQIEANRKSVKKGGTQSTLRAELPRSNSLNTDACFGENVSKVV